MTANQLSYWRNVETERSNRAQERIGQQNADSNTLTAQSRERDSYTNVRNAATNERNADTNLFNAHSQRMNVGINQQNANTNAMNASTNARNAATQEIQVGNQAAYWKESTDIAGNRANFQNYLDAARTADTVASTAERVSKEARAWISPGSYLFGK